MRYVMLLILPLMISCHAETTTNSDARDSNTIIPAERESNESEQANTDSIIKMTFHPGQLLSTTLEKKYQRIHVEIPEVEADSLIGKLMLPGENRNVYVSHLILPDNETDGPFGNEIRYATKDTGTYTLIIGPNTRAEGNPLGEVNIEIDLK